MVEPSLATSNFSKNEINFVGEIKGSFKLKKLIPGTNIPILNEKHLINKKIDFITLNGSLTSNNSIQIKTGINQIAEKTDGECFNIGIPSVSYTHLTLPTKA